MKTQIFLVMEWRWILEVLEEGDEFQNVMYEILKI